MAENPRAAGELSLIHRNEARREEGRFDLATSREDLSNPYSRKGSTVSKSAYVNAGSSSHGNLHRWVQSLGGEADLSRPYAQHAWVYACVAAIGRSASSVPLRLQKAAFDGDNKTVVEGTLPDVFANPNPLQSQRKFLRAICTSQQLYGETFLLLLKQRESSGLSPVEARGGGGMTAKIEMPDEIWPVRGDLVDALIDPETKLPAAWRFQTDTGHVDYPAHAVVQIAEVNPYNPLRGMGPMQAAYRTAAKDFVIDRYDEALLQNGGSPGGILSVDGPLTDADQRAIRESWREAHSRPESHQKTAVLPKGTTYQEIGLSPAQMEHKELRNWDRQTILSIFGVPPVTLGLETLNYATAREQNRIFWETTILPYLDFIADELQHKLIRRLDDPSSELTIDFDTTKTTALREDIDKKVERTLKLYTEGHRSFHESARLAGWEIDEETITGAEERWIPNNLRAAEGALDPVVEDDDEEIVEEFNEPDEVKTLGVSSEGTSYLDAEPCVDPRAWPHHLENLDDRYAFFKTLDVAEEEAVGRLTPKAARVIRDFLLAQRKRLREVAKKGKATKEATSVSKYVPTEAEVRRMLAINEEYWADELATAMKPTLAKMMVDGAAGAAVELGASVAISAVTDPIILAFYKEFPAFLKETSINTLNKDITRVIIRELARVDGIGSIATIQEAVRLALVELEDKVMVMVDQIEARAAAIARTEVTKAHNGARLAEFKAQGLEKHQWINSGDGAVRDEHREPLNLEIVRVGEPFLNGCAYPGDPAGGAREVVNCRCRTIPVVD